MIQIKNSAERYGLISKIFHWVMFVLVVYLLLDHEITHGLPRGDETRRFFVWLHQSIGIIVFLLVCLRLIWVFLNKKPEHESTTPIWMRKLSTISHWILYLAVLMQPISGMLGKLLDGRAVPFFNIFRIPPLTLSDGLAVEVIKTIHYDVIPTGLKIFIILHLLAALYHHFIVKDNVLKRMTWGA